MLLSVVIVSYNVQYFLEQCLHSVFNSGENIPMEVFVVDNHSTDGSVDMVRKKFPRVKLIANNNNLGFSKANNQAIRQASGRYILLLNPDTVVEDKTLPKVVDFMEKHPEAGALGVKMLDGQGKFLPESKRGLPTPGVAFCKIFGLSALFPKSKTFGKYHLGYLDNDQTHQVEVLSGAFMLLRKEALDRAGLLDEDFFMYGEDIDLSYRLEKTGYRNYYYPEARIIHYKGESTKKSSINYVMVFYNAMIIFARKHFSRKNARTFSLLINLAIYLRAMIAIVSRFFRRIFWPAVDAAIIYGGFLYLTNYWGHHMFAAEGTYYPPGFMYLMVPAYIIIWLSAVYVSGGYDHPPGLFRIVRGIGLGTIAILVIYALLPIHLRFSRALILLGSIWALFSMVFTRTLYTLVKYKTLHVGRPGNKRVIVVGKEQEAGRIFQMLRQGGHTSFMGLVSPEEELPRDKGYLGTVDQLEDIAGIYQVNEVVFCAGDISSRSIINTMSSLQDKQLNFKIAPPESLYIIGSNSIEPFGDLFTINVNSINLPANRRNKRLFDLFFALLLLITFPLHLVFQRYRWGFLKNVLYVLAGKISWVGYHSSPGRNKLPVLKPGVLAPGDMIQNQPLQENTRENLNNLYAKDYKVENDLHICITKYSYLGQPAHTS
ncbi:MAG: glycosyltransferase [Bacteroidales bacterium]